MTTNPYGNASNAYLQTRDENMGQMEIVLECFKGIIRFIRSAKSAYQEDKLDTMCYWIGRASKVIEALHANLDMEQGGEDAEFLQEFYVTLLGRFGKILERPDVTHEFDQLLGYVQPVYERWYKLTHGSLPKAVEAEEEEMPPVLSDKIH